MTKAPKPLDWARLIALQEDDGIRVVEADNIRTPQDRPAAEAALEAVIANIQHDRERGRS